MFTDFDLYLVCVCMWRKKSFICCQWVTVIQLQCIKHILYKIYNRHAFDDFLLASDWWLFWAIFNYIMARTCLISKRSWSYVLFVLEQHARLDFWIWINTIQNHHWYKRIDERAAKLVTDRECLFEALNCLCACCVLR